MIIFLTITQHNDSSPREKWLVDLIMNFFRLVQLHNEEIKVVMKVKR
jgi:hypothetical protein